MEKENKEKAINFFTKLYRRRRFLLWHIIITCVIAVIISLSVKKTFISSATVLPPSSTSPFLSFLPESMSQGLGGTIRSLTGGSGDDTFKLMSILNSRNLAESAVHEFDLDEKFEAPVIEDAIELYRELVSYTIDDQGMVQISVAAKTEWFHPEESEKATQQFSQDLANYVVNFTDSVFTELQIERARKERLLVEQRYEQNKKDLRQAERALKEFSEKHGVIALPEQLSASISAAANIESQILINRVELGVLKRFYNENNAEISRKEMTIDELSSSLYEFQQFGSMTDSMGVLPSFSEAPSLILEFAQIQREIEVQNILYQFLTQRYEQVKLEEGKQTPSLQFIDAPQYPTRKAAPVRSILTIVLVIIGTILGAGYIIIADFYWNDAKQFYQRVKDES